MEKNRCGNRHSPELRERAVRMVLEHQGELDSQSAAIKSIAPKIGCGPDTLRAWVWRAETDNCRMPLKSGRKSVKLLPLQFSLPVPKAQHV